MHIGTFLEDKIISSQHQYCMSTHKTATFPKRGQNICYAFETILMIYTRTDINKD